MKFYLNTNVVEEAYKRVEYLFKEMDNVVVSMSGGKDSTVIFKIALDVAREHNRLPLDVVWLDQEFEWKATVDYMREIMYMEEVRPHWLQFSFLLSNSATTTESEFINVWDEKRKGNWIHDKDPISIKENNLGTNRFYKILDTYDVVAFKGKTAIITGLRGEENPKRLLGLTQSRTYKHITWGKKLDEEHFTFSPIYDWSFKDVWKFIYDKNLKYNRVYDYFYNYNYPLKNMRVSSLCHEISIKQAKLIHEIEPETWERAIKFIPGLNSFDHIDFDELIPNKLPKMFKTWEEYREYLLVNIVDKRHHNYYRKKFKIFDKYFAYIGEEIGYWKKCISSIVYNDVDELVKLENFRKTPLAVAYLRWLRTGKITDKKEYNKWIKIHLNKLKEDGRIKKTN